MKIRYNFDTTPARSKLMSRIRGTNTKPELMLRKELWKLGLRYRLHVRKQGVRPDIVFEKYKIVVFVDGAFWHGHDWQNKKHKIKANRQYWVEKIERNIQRDKENNALLAAQGYRVLRFWEHEINKDLSGCVMKIVKQIVNASRHQ